MKPKPRRKTKPKRPTPPKPTLRTPEDVVEMLDLILECEAPRSFFERVREAMGEPDWTVELRHAVEPETEAMIVEGVRRWLLKRAEAEWRAARTKTLRRMAGRVVEALKDCKEGTGE